MNQAQTDRLSILLRGIALSGLVASLVLWHLNLALTFWFACVVPVLAALVVEVLRSLARDEMGHVIVASFLMSVVLTLGKTLSAAVVAVKYSGDTFLESFAKGRARRGLRSHAQRAAAHHRNEGLKEKLRDDSNPGDRLLIPLGNAAPIDRWITGVPACFDTSALTRETPQVRLDGGAEAMSRPPNAAEAFDIKAAREAKERTYPEIVQLVEETQTPKAPVARQADHWSRGFLVVTGVIAFVACWSTANPLGAVAVLVVATPCPLAVPAGVVAWLGRATHFGAPIKGARPLEVMAPIGTLILDNTGTISDGPPQIVSLDSHEGVNADDTPCHAAALDQVPRPPVVKASVVAMDRGLTQPIPKELVEIPGESVIGYIDGSQFIVGDDGFIAAHVGRVSGKHPDLVAGPVKVAPWRQGVGRILLVIGCYTEVGRRVTEGLGLDGIRAGVSPDENILPVLTERKNVPLIMLGYGANDAHALAVSDIGVAMLAHGTTAGGDAAQFVLLRERVDRLAPRSGIVRRSRRIALKSVVARIGLSVLRKVVATFGCVPPCRAC